LRSSKSPARSDIYPLDEPAPSRINFFCEKLKPRRLVVIIFLKRMFLATTVAGLFGCTGSTTIQSTSNEAQYYQQLVLPEVKEGLIEPNRFGHPYKPVWWKINSYSSGNAYQQGLVKEVYRKYPGISSEIDQTFTPKWIYEVYKFGYKGGGRESGLKTDLAIYKAVKSEAEYRMAETLLAKAEELHQFGEFSEEDLSSNYTFIKKYKMDFAEGGFIIENRVPKLYKFKGKPLTGVNLPRFYDYMLKSDQKSLGDYGFHMVDGKPQKIKISSANMEVWPNGMHYYTFNKAGTYHVTYSLAGKSVRIPIEVVDLPFKEGASMDEVISKFGLPNQDEYYVVSWPCSIQPNGLLHEPSASTRTMAVTHIAYDEYPSLILELQNQRVWDVTSKSKLALDNDSRNSCR
jgi:hypothetical protein